MRQHEGLLADAGKLRRHAEDLLRKRMSISGKVKNNGEMFRQLYELQINQIEIDLLNAEFWQLQQAGKAPRADETHHADPGKVTRIGYLILDRGGVIREAKSQNSRYEEVLPSNLVGQRIEKCFYADDRPGFAAFLAKVFKSKAKEMCELRLDCFQTQKAPASRPPVFVRIEAITDAAGQSCLAVVNDNTGSKLAEQQERARNALMETLHKTIAASLNEIFIFEAENFHFIFANHCALENLGYTLEEMKALTPLDIQPHFSEEEFRSITAPLLSRKKAMQEFKTVYRRKDGRLYPVEVHLQFLEQEGERHFLAVVLDITKQVATESQLRSIVEAAEAIIWATDAGLRPIFVSRHVEKILGYGTEQFTGQFIGKVLHGMPAPDFFHEEDSAKLIMAANQALAEGKIVSGLSHRARHADGTWKWLSLSMTPTFDADGKLNQVVGVMHDIHAQKQAEDELLRMNHELDRRVNEEVRKNVEKDTILLQQTRLAGMGEMIGNIAHQWRQPINSLGLILANIEDMVAYGECDRQAMHDAVEKSNAIIQKMSRTIDDFRNFFRDDKSLGAFGLQQVTGECLSLVEAAMRNSQINIEVKCGREVMVWGYANEYSHALMNLLSNAKDAIIENHIAAGRIEIEIGEDEKSGWEIVTDNGGGIAEGLMQKIFVPHFTTKAHGVGIGLYMARTSIEKNMSGRIRAKNTVDGAQFTIQMPKICHESCNTR